MFFYVELEKRVLRLIDCLKITDWKKFKFIVKIFDFIPKN